MKQELITKIENRVRKLVPRLNGEDYLNELNKEIEELRTEPVIYGEDIEENQFEINNLKEEVRNFKGYQIHLENILEAIDIVNGGRDILCNIICGELNVKRDITKETYLDYKLSLPLSEQTEETLLALDKLLN